MQKSYRGDGEDERKHAEDDVGQGQLETETEGWRYQFGAVEPCARNAFLEQLAVVLQASLSEKHTP